MATLATAPTIWGLYTPSPGNPILCAPSKTSLFQTVGHADLFQDQAGGWWTCALATRVIGDSFPIGRESTLVPVDWSGEWPIPDLRGLDVLLESVLPKAIVGEEAWDDLLQPPRHRLLHLRNPDRSCYEITDDAVTLRPSRVPLSAPLGSPTFLAVRQRDLFFEVEATFTLPSKLGVRTGIAVLNDHERFFAISLEGSGRAALVSATDRTPFAGSLDGAEAVTLRIRGTPSTYTFDLARATDTTQRGGGASRAWERLGEGASKELNGGFMGAVLALFSESDGGAGTEEVETRVTGWRYRAR